MNREFGFAREKQLRGDLAGAEIDLVNVLKKEPNFYPAQHNLGLLKLTKGDVGGALIWLGKADTIRRRDRINDPSFLSTYGWAYLNDGNFSGAESLFKESYDTSAEDPKVRVRALNNLGFLYLQKGDLLHARNSLNEALFQYGSAASAEIEKLVEDYDRRTSVGIFGAANVGWVQFGSHDKTGKWVVRWFTNVDGIEQVEAKAGETLVAKGLLNLRAEYPTPKGETPHLLQYGPITSVINKGQPVKVLEVKELNTPQTWLKVQVVSPRGFETNDNLTVPP